MKAIIQKYERFLMPVTLLAGTALDFFTFNTIQIKTQLILLVIYFVLAGLCIAYIHLHDSKGQIDRHPISRFARLTSQATLQFTFGALLSSSLVFYWYSGALGVSWPVILLLAILMVSNEAFRHYYSKPIVQIAVYFFTAFSLLTLILPVVFNSLSVWLFVYAGVLSLVFISFYIAGLARLVLHLREKTYRLFIPVLCILAGMNALYFFNMIPPIPLSLREAGVYHNIKRSGSDYVMQEEDQRWFESLLPGQTVHLAAGEKVYIYASIFAPADLNTQVVHHWQYYDASMGKWVSKDKLSYSITGGRKLGYRGYTLKSSVLPGKWRVDVETPRGLVLGRINFTVVAVDKPPFLFEVKR